MSKEMTFESANKELDSIIEKRNIEFKISKHNELVSKNIDQAGKFIDKINIKIKEKIFFKYFINFPSSL